MNPSDEKLGRGTAGHFIRVSVLFLVSMMLFVWALWGYGIPTPAVRWVVAEMALAFAGVAWAQGTRWQAFAGWAAVALVGQACALQLVEAGRINRLQLFHDWQSLLTSFRSIFLLAVLVQAAVAGWAARRWLRSAIANSMALVSWPQLLGLGILLSFAAATFSPATVQALVRGGFAYKAAVHATKVGLGLLILVASALTMALGVAAFPQDAWEKLAASWKACNRRKLAVYGALFVVFGSSLLSWFVLDRLPHVPDDVAYLFHAKYFAAGRLYLPAPPEPLAFSIAMTLVDGDKWYSAQLPGWPAVLALGAWAGVPWLVNPLLAGLAILLAYTFVQQLHGEDVAAASALLLAGSPWLLYMSASYMGHSVSLVLTLGSLLGAQRARETGSLLGAAAAGLCLGGLALTRPLEALAVAVPIGLWWLAIGWRRLRLAAVVLAAVCCLALTGLMLAYNKGVTGDPLAMPFEKITDLSVYTGANRVGFGRNVGNFGWAHLDPLPGHGPLDVIVNTNQNLYMVNFELFGWACGSLLFVFLLVVSGQWRKDALMWGLVLAIWAAMSCYWFSGGPDFGARYWYQMIFPLTVLTVRGAKELERRWSVASSASPERGRRIWGFVMLASLLALLNVVPWRAIDKYKKYRNVSGGVRELERKHRFGRSLVFLRGEGLRSQFASSLYASAFALNPNTLDRNAPGPIYARDLGPESRERLRRYYSDRPVWIVADPVTTGGGFELLEGPLPPLAVGRAPESTPDKKEELR